MKLGSRNLAPESEILKARKGIEEETEGFRKRKAFRSFVWKFITFMKFITPGLTRGYGGDGDGDGDDVDGVDEMMLIII